MERIDVCSEPDVFLARRIGREMAAHLGFNPIAVGEIETVISELARNLVRHRAVSGAITLRPIAGDRAGIEVGSEDAGPGIGDIEAALAGGWSTAGSLGIGLSGVKRLMDEFSIDSAAGRGTLITARKMLPDQAVRRMDFSVLARPRKGEDVSGDAWFIRHAVSGTTFGLIDALGHGPEAHEVSLMTLAMLDNHHTESLLSIAETCHRGLKDTRGAAMALCRVLPGEGRLEHLSIGNIETRVYGTPIPVRPFCFNGTLGMAMENHKVLSYPCADGATIVMFTDGVSGRFEIPPAMLSKKPTEVATFIFDSHARDHDDATVLVGR